MWQGAILATLSRTTKKWKNQSWIKPRSQQSPIQPTNQPINLANCDDKNSVYSYIYTKTVDIMKVNIINEIVKYISFITQLNNYFADYSNKCFA